MIVYVTHQLLGGVVRESDMASLDCAANAQLEALLVFIPVTSGGDFCKYPKVDYPEYLDIRSDRRAFERMDIQ